MNRFFFIICLISFWTLVALKVSAQGIQTDFGKNRVQFKEFDWKYYESDHFITYWYEEGRTLGEFAVQMSERDFRELQYILEYRLNEKIKILVYNDLDDLQQSNIGNEETFYNSGGTTRIVGKKIFVYFNGDKRDLRKQIREGITQVYLNQMMFGGNLQEVVQNAVLLNLPQWFTQGLVAFVGEDWNATLDNQMKDAFLSGEYNDFFDFVKQDARLAGHSMWYFISENYGQSTVSNLLYLTRINRSIESGYLYVLGNTFRQTADTWFKYFQERYTQDALAGNPPIGNMLSLPRQGSKQVRQLAYSPKGQAIAYTLEENGKFKIYLHQIVADESKLIFSAGINNPIQLAGTNYPIIAWNRTGTILSIIYGQRDKVKCSNYSLASGKIQTHAFKYDGLESVVDADYISPSMLVISAVFEGQSDLFTIGQKGNGLNRITRDRFDDKEVSYVQINGVSGVLFSSNRDQTELRPENYRSYQEPKTYDMYFLPLEGDSRTILRITDTPYANEKKPIQLDSQRVAFLSDENGIYNRVSATVDTVITRYDTYVRLSSGEEYEISEDSLKRLDATVIDTVFEVPFFEAVAFTKINTNLSRGIEDQSSVYRFNKQADLFLVNGDYEVRLSTVNDTALDSIPNSLYRTLFLEALEPVEDETAPVIDNRLKEVDQPRKVSPPKKEDSGFFFIDEFTEVEPEPVVKDTVPPVKPETAPMDTVQKIDIDNYFFQTEFDNVEAPAAVIVEDQKTGEIRLQNPATLQPFVDPPFAPVAIDPEAIEDYRLQLKTNFVGITLDNSFLVRGLESFAFNETFYEYPNLGILLRGTIKDVHENHIFTGGVRVPVTFNGVEYFMNYRNTKKRLDKEFNFYRRSRTETTSISSFNEFLTRQFTHILDARISYPINIYSSIRATGIIRTDRLTLLATEEAALNDPNEFWRFFPKLTNRGDELNNTRLNDYYVGGRVEFVFDNTRDISVNIKNGTRYKVFAEVRKPFDLNLLEPNDDFSFKFEDGINAQFGFDARHYYPIDRFSILAGRIAAATSVGSIRNLYFLGGVDNWIFSEANREIPVRQDGNFAYQTLASNMRGFNNNIRNGTSYVVMNAEARFPIFNYLSKNPLKSSFLRNFQLIGFFDMGTAWEGSSPFSDDNPLNTVVIGSPTSPVEVRVEYFRNPVVMGVGGGIRTTLFGYFVRLDYAVGFETGVAQDPVFYFSLGKDF